MLCMLGSITVDLDGIIISLSCAQKCIRLLVKGTAAQCKTSNGICLLEV